MFGWLIGNEVNDDAIRLKTLTDLVIDKYLPLNNQEIIHALGQDFAPEMYDVTEYEVIFEFESVPYFVFKIYLDTNTTQLPKGIVVLGRGRYAGFSLSYNSGSWFCRIDGGVTGAATGGARKLSKVMEKKFQIPDINRALGL